MIKHQHLRLGFCSAVTSWPARSTADQVFTSSPERQFCLGAPFSVFGPDASRLDAVAQRASWAGKVHGVVRRGSVLVRPQLSLRAGGLWFTRCLHSVESSLEPLFGPDARRLIAAVQRVSRAWRVAGMDGGRAGVMQHQ